MWKYRIQRQKGFAALPMNKLIGKVFDTEAEAKKALETLPPGHEIVAFMRPSFNPLA